MKARWIHAGVFLYGSVLLSAALFAQGGQRGIPAADPKNATKPFDKHDLSGFWTRNGSPGGYGGGGTCRDCGDRGFGNDVPSFTPLGQKMFDANKRVRERLKATRLDTIFDIFYDDTAA
jgi:hypothetical protein